MMRSITFLIAGVVLLAGASTSPAQTRFVKFDSTAEITVKGIVDQVIAVTDTEGNVGVHMTVRTPAGLVVVRVGPAMYIGMNNFSFLMDDEVEVTGLPIGTRSTALVAKQITKQGRILTLRDETGAPVWPAMLEGSDGCGIQHVANADGTH